MKKIHLLTVAFACCAFLIAGQVKAQNVGVAADKQKQENLEKTKKRQAELKKKYNSMTPEQAKEAERRANEYKRSGGKTGKPAQPAVQPTAKPASKSTVAPKQGNVAKPSGSKQPVWMDSKGKPKATPSAAQPGKQEVKPKGTATKEVKPAAKTTTPKPAAKPAVAKEKKTAGTK